ncbi:MAG: hypothetical protein P3A28_09790, partial [Gemmatimonadota bacterium]|nr:hypothetical protein [Gemmatimonadota bacterium]
IMHTPAGKCDADQRIELRPARVEVPAAQRDSQLSQITANAARYGAPPPDLNRVPRQFPAFDAVFTDAAGRVWVERLRSPAARYFEVFSARGVLVAEVESPVTFQGYRPFIIGADRVIGFIADADEIVHLASFRIVRGGRGG